MISIFAQVVSVWVIFIQGPGQMYPSQFIESVIPQVQETYAEIGVPVFFERVASYTGDFPAPTLETYGGAYYRALYRLARQLKVLRRNRVVFFVVPPSSDGGYMLGAARRFCFRQGRNAVLYKAMAFAVGQERNINGAYRLPWVSLEVNHEMGHSLNAQHVTSRTIMNTNALSIYQQELQAGNLTYEQSLPWDKRSATQIQKCVNWRRR